jgi:hypothetical protein
MIPHIFIVLYSSLLIYVNNIAERGKSDYIPLPPYHKNLKVGHSWRNEKLGKDENSSTLSAHSIKNCLSILN